jgi:hypothetical protein
MGRSSPQVVSARQVQFSWPGGVSAPGTGAASQLRILACSPKTRKMNVRRRQDLSLARIQGHPPAAAPALLLGQTSVATPLGIPEKTSRWPTTATQTWAYSTTW